MGHRFIFCSRRLGIKRGLTKSELFRELESRGQDYTNIQRGLNLCGMVEFAKYRPNDEDFGEIVRIAMGVIK